MKVLRCPECGNVRRTQRASRTCSLRCGQAAAKKRDPRRYHELHVKAGLASGLKSRERSIAHWSAKFPGVDVAIVRRILAAGYHAGDLSGHKRGFDQGFAAGEAAERMRRPA